MSVPIQQIEQVTHKLQTLSQERITEVEDFIDFLKQRGKGLHLTKSTMKLTEPLLASLWNNTEDTEYDPL